MDCEQVRELLPWYLNQTLEEPEQDAVTAHLETCASCRLELEETRSAGAIFGQHIPPEQLIDRALSVEAGPESDTLRRHLDSCPQCRGELELIRASADSIEAETATDQPARLTAPAALAVYRTLAMAASVLLAVTAATWWWTWQGQGERLAHLEAQLGAVTAARGAGDESEKLSALEAKLEQLAAASERLKGEVDAERERASALAKSLAELGRLRPNLSLVDLFPASLTVRGETAEAARVPRSEAPVTIVLNTGLRDIGEGLALELVDDEGAVVERRDGLAPAPDGSFVISVATAQYRPGQYAIRVCQGHGGQRQVLETYPFWIE